MRLLLLLVSVNTVISSIAHTVLKAVVMPVKVVLDLALGFEETRTVAGFRPVLRVTTVINTVGVHVTP